MKSIEIYFFRLTQLVRQQFKFCNLHGKNGIKSNPTIMLAFSIRSFTINNDKKCIRTTEY